jgi:MFS family permease
MKEAPRGDAGATAASAVAEERYGIEPSASSWGLLAIFTLLNVLNFVDRSLISALAPLLIADLGLSRTEIGWLAGFGFVVFYTLVGLLLGFAADRWRRVPLVAGGLALWSGMTALSGWARSFLGLALPRVFVGVGEATLTPSALSMLGDVFPPQRLALATGVYYAGIPIGASLGFIASSYIAPQYGWRSCFFALGGAGVVAAALLLLVREPARRGAGPRVERPPLGRLARDLGRVLVARPDLAWTLVGGSMLCYGSGSALHAVTWLVEERGYAYADAAFKAGIVAVLAGLLGNLAGGAFGDWCARRFPNGHLWSLIPMTAFFVPASLLFYSLPARSPGFYLCWPLAAAGTSAWFGPLFAALQGLAPRHLRASAVAVALLVLNLLGVGPGPLITGMIGDRWGLTAGLLSSLVVVAASVVPFFLAARRAPAPRA